MTITAHARRDPRPRSHVPAARQVHACATSRRPRGIRSCFEQAGLALPAVLVDGAIGVDFLPPSPCSGVPDWSRVSISRTPTWTCSSQAPRPRAPLTWNQVMLYAEPSYGGYGLTVNPPGISKCRH